jgi:hypothetical protein
MKDSPWNIKFRYFQKPIKKTYIKNKGFFRKTFFREWTIGYDLNNRVILQFTKNVPKTKIFLLNLWFFAFRRAWKPGKSDEFRIWINFGWNQGLPIIRAILILRMKMRFDRMMMGFSNGMTCLIDKMFHEAKESENT